MGTADLPTSVSGGWLCHVGIACPGCARDGHALTAQWLGDTAVPAPRIELGGGRGFHQRGCTAHPTATQPQKNLLQVRNKWPLGASPALPSSAAAPGLPHLLCPRYS